MAKARAKATKLRQSRREDPKGAGRKKIGSAVPPLEEEDDKAEAMRAMNASAGDEEWGEDEDELEDFPVLSGKLRSHEPDPRVVDAVTDRIFAAVLSRYGWERQGKRIEHVGPARRRR